jgi:predicted methyltransferase
LKTGTTPDTDDRKLQQRYRIRVTLFALCLVSTLVVLWVVNDALQALNRLDRVERERDQWQHPVEVIQELNLKEGSAVADLGSGVGYFSLKLSDVVGKSGKVLPIDILKFPLYVLRIRALMDGRHNIRTILGDPDDPHLPAGSLDAVLIVNTYHELADSKAILVHVLQSLKPGGRLVVVDHGPIAGTTGIRSVEAGHHEISPDLVEAEIRGQGLEILRRQDHFADQPGEDHIWWLIVARKPLSL